MYRRNFFKIKSLLLWAIMLSAVIFANAQQPQTGRGTYLKAVFLDSTNREPVEFGTMSAHNSANSKLVKYALTDEKGVAIINGIQKGKWNVKFEYMGYKPKSIDVEIKQGANDLVEILIQPDVSSLEGITVTAHANAMQVKKDTIEYNAAAYKINDSDMLEELLKKLPGVEIDSDGNITANGKTINKIMIDGKTFFLDDPSLATKNLPAKIVNKVRVVERKSDQARFTGIDDGEEETVLDLGLKPGMMNGWFGNLMGGYGTKDRFETGAMIGRFTKTTQISLIENGNNTNNRGFNDVASSMMGGMRGGGGMWGGSGINTSWMGGLNVNTEVLDGKMKLSGNYMYSNNKKEVERKQDRETFLTEENTQRNLENGAEESTTYNHRAAAEMDYSITDNTSILFRPRFNVGGGDFVRTNDFRTYRNDTLTNSGLSNNSGKNDFTSTEGMLLLRQRLGKPGRTISLGLNYSYSDNELDGYNRSETKFYTNKLNADGSYEPIETSSTVIDQRYLQNENTYSLRGRISYTEPLGRNYFMEGTYSYSYKRSTSDKDTYNVDANGEYTIADSEYSNHYKNIFINQRAELNFMKREDKYSLTVGASMQPATTKSYGRTDRDTSYSVINFAPSARFDYNFSESKMLRIRYRGRTSQPSINQLMPIPDNSNPLKISLGNPNLNPEFSHNIWMEYRTNNMQKQSWVGVMFDASYTTDKIVSRISYDDQGVQYVKPYNDNTGIYSANLGAMMNFRLWNSNFSLSSFGNVGFGNGVNYTTISGGSGESGLTQEGVKNVTKSLRVRENLRVTFRNTFMELSAGGRINYQNAWYTVKSLSKADTWTNSITGSANINIPGGFNVTSDIARTFYIGFDEGYNDPVTMWNAELSKTLFKGNATLKVKIYDILKQEKTTSRTTTENYIQDVQTNALGQYVMFSLVYRFGKFNGADMRRMGPPGGPGRRGPGGPGRR